MAVLIKLCQKLFIVRETNKQYGVIPKITIVFFHNYFPVAVSILNNVY